MVLSAICGVLISCEPSVDYAYDTSYISQLEGDYEIQCTYTYYDSVQGYIDIDTTYSTTIVFTNNYVNVPLYDGTEVATRFGPNTTDNTDYKQGHFMVYSFHEEGFKYNSDWDITPSFTRFWMSLNDNVHYSDYLPYGGHLHLIAMKQ